MAKKQNKDQRKLKRNCETWSKVKFTQISYRKCINDPLLACPPWGGYF